MTDRANDSRNSRSDSSSNSRSDSSSNSRSDSSSNSRSDSSSSSSPGKPLVTVITPCYNGERFIEQWAQNLMSQDYPNVEVIFVNDGSADNTAAAFIAAEEQLHRRDYIVRYVEKANGGAADAVNTALKLVNGAYIMLLDMDDFLFPEAISAKADFLTEHEDIDFVMNDGYVVREQNLDDRSTLLEEGAYRLNKHQFDDFLNMRAITYPGSYMVRSGALFARLKDRSIYISPYGQNFQMLMPVACFGKGGYIDKPLMKYVHYAASASHTRSFERRVELHDGYEGNAVGTIMYLDIPQSEKDKYIETIKKASLEGRFTIGIEYRKHELIKDQYIKMAEQGLITKRIRWLYILTRIPLGCFIISTFSRMKRVRKRLLYRMKKSFFGKDL